MDTGSGATKLIAWFAINIQDQITASVVLLADAHGSSESFADLKKLSEKLVLKLHL